MIARSSAPAKRRAAAVESFKTAAECIGPIEPGMSLFAITRGQFSMLDAVLHTLEGRTGARVVLWSRFMFALNDAMAVIERDPRITSASLLVDRRTVRDELVAIERWSRRFGAASVRVAEVHAKVATVEVDGLRVVIHGSTPISKTDTIDTISVTEGDAEAWDRIDATTVAAHAWTGGALPKAPPGLGASGIARARCRGATLAAAEARGEGLAITRGDYSLIDVIEAEARRLGGPVDLSVWATALGGAEYPHEFARLLGMRESGLLSRATLFLHHTARYDTKRDFGASQLVWWCRTFGPDSVRLAFVHAKMAVVTTADGQGAVIHGSANFNFNPRIEQIETLRDPAVVALARSVEMGIPCLPGDATADQVAHGCGRAAMSGASRMAPFRDCKRWAP